MVRVHELKLTMISLSLRILAVVEIWIPKSRRGMDIQQKYIPPVLTDHINHNTVVLIVCSESSIF